MHRGVVAGYGSKRLCKDCGDNVGKVPLSAGAGSNLQRPTGRAHRKAGRRIRDWRMSLFERRRRGNALRGSRKDYSLRGNTSKGQRGSRHLVGTVCNSGEGLRTYQLGNCYSGIEPFSKPIAIGAYAYQSLSFSAIGKATVGNAKVANRTREIRLSGMKTEAWRNVTYGGIVNPPVDSRKGRDGNPQPKSARAPDLSKL